MGTESPTRRKTPPPPTRPSGDVEKELALLQRTVSRGAIAVRRRNALLCGMKERGYTLRDLTAILNHAAVTEGDAAMTEDTVQKAIRRTREVNGHAGR